MVSASLIFSGFMPTLKHNRTICAIIYDAVYMKQAKTLMVPRAGKSTSKQPGENATSSNAWRIISRGKGNRTQTKAGGDQTGGNQRIANYAANSLNQITSRDYPGTNDVVGVALATNEVTVNGQAAWHKGEYFWGTVKTNNASAPQWQQVTVASGGGTSAGGLYVPQTREQLRYDGDGNLTNDGRWAYTWDAENRLVRMTVNTNVGPQYQLTFAYDAKGRRKLNSTRQP